MSDPNDDPKYTNLDVSGAAPTHVHTFDADPTGGTAAKGGGMSSQAFADYMQTLLAIMLADIGDMSGFMRTVNAAVDAAAARTTLDAVGLVGDEGVAGEKTFTGAHRITAAATVVNQDPTDAESVHNFGTADGRYFLPEQVNHIPAIAVHPKVTLVGAINLDVTGDRLRWSTTTAAQGAKFPVSDSFGTTEGAGQSTSLGGRNLDYYFTTSRSPSASILRIGFGTSLSVVLGDFVIADFGIQFQMKQDAGEFTRIIAADGVSALADTGFIQDDTLFSTGDFEHFRLRTNKTDAQIWRKINAGEWVLFNTLPIPAALLGSYGTNNRYLLVEQERLLTGGTLFQDFINQKTVTH